MIFRLSGEPGTTTTLPPSDSTSDASSVASASLAVRGPEGLRPERLRRLHGHQPVAVDGRAVVGAERVVDGRARQRRVGPGPHRADHGCEQGVLGQRAGGVVNHDDVCRRRHGGQAGTHRPGTRGGTGHDRVRARFVVARVVVGHDQDDAVGGRPRRVERPVQHPASGERLVLLRSPETTARTGRHDDHPHA